jgi:transmembrane sensor
LHNRITYLIDKKASGEISEQEILELERLLTEEHRDVFGEIIAGALASEKELLQEDHAGWNLRIQQVIDADRVIHHRRKARILSIPVRRIVAAASVILVLAVASYVWLINRKSDGSTETAGKSEIPAGIDGALLTLADGQQVSLDTIQNKVIALQGGVTAKVVNGVLVYEGDGSQVVYNTVSTPKGRQYQVTLPDSTKVWLNSASSIYYPTVFAGNERRVEVTGEVYLEVTKNKQKPFRLLVNKKTEVEVLGTHFNVNAYLDEPAVRVTLLEGSVKVSDGKSAELLKPGQQASVQAGITVKDVAVDLVMSWREGIFLLENTDFDALMRQINRWYDVKIVYESAVPKVSFGGGVSRDQPISKILEILEQYGVRYKLENKVLTIQ